MNFTKIIKKIGKALIIITELQKIQFEEIISGRIENIIIETSFYLRKYQIFGMEINLVICFVFLC